MLTGSLEVKPIDLCNWPDLECLFEARGGPHYCWCMLWRKKPPGFQAGSGSVRRGRLKSLMRGYVERRDPIGLVGYVEGTPFGWVSVAPRGKGLCETLASLAVNYAKVQGADLVESFPVGDDSPTYRHMGRVGMFLELGFEPAGKVGARRNAMLLEFKCGGSSGR